MYRRPPRVTRSDTPFPYTTLFRPCRPTRSAVSVRAAMAGLASAWINIFRIDSLLQKERAKTQNGRRSLTKIKIWPGARPGIGFIRAATCHLILIVHDLGAHDAVNRRLVNTALRQEQRRVGKECVQ